MKSRAIVALVVVLPILILAAGAAAAPPDASGEYSKHFAALSRLSVAVAQAMPPEKYSFRPHPDSMTFGELMSHIAKTNYQFCAGLKDAAPPAFPSGVEKSGILLGSVTNPYSKPGSSRVDPLSANPHATEVN